MSLADGGLKMTSADDFGMDRIRWRRVVELCEELTSRDLLPALSVCVARGDRCLEPLAFGRRRLSEPLAKTQPDGRFVIASLTKPIVATGVLALVEQGRIGLNDRVSEYLPEYRDAAKRATTIR